MGWRQKQERNRGTRKCGGLDFIQGKNKSAPLLPKQLGGVSERTERCHRRAP